MQKLLYLRNSMNDLHNIWHDNAEHVSSVSAVKIFFLKIQDGRSLMHLRDPLCVMRYCDFLILRWRLRWVILLQCRDITIFVFFSEM